MRIDVTGGPTSPSVVEVSTGVVGVPLGDKGAPGGVATLAADGTLDATQIPATVARTATTVRAGKGLYIPPGWGESWKAKRDAAKTGGKAKVMCVGDSLTYGYWSSDLIHKNWVGLVRDSLQASYGDGGSGMFSANRSGEFVGTGRDATIALWRANNSITTTTGTWTDTGLFYGPAVSSMYATAAATATFKVRGTTVNIYTLAGVNTPNAGYTYAIDGAAPVAVADPGLSTGTVQVKTVTGLAAGDHTVVIAYNGTGGARLQLIGVSAENASGVVVDNMGRSGARTDTFFTSGTGNTLWNGGASNPADLIIYSLSINDAQASIAVDTWVSNVISTLSTFMVVNNGATDVMLLFQHRGNYTSGTFYAQYLSRARGLAEAYGAALVNIWPMGRNSYPYWTSLGYWGDSANAGAAGTDVVHLSDAGHQFIANQLIPILTA